MTKSNGSITKQVTGSIFDLTKIGIGDIVEFTGSREPLAGIDVPIRKAGIVKRVNDYEIVVTTTIREGSYPFDNPIQDDFISAEKAEEADIKLLFRSYFNVEGTEEEANYGRQG